MSEKTFLPKMSFLTEREKQVYRLVKELGSQKGAAERLGVVDSAITSAMKGIRIKYLKFLNTARELKELGILREEDIEAILKPEKD